MKKLPSAELSSRQQLGGASPKRSKAALWIATLFAGVGIGSCVTNAPVAHQKPSGGAGDSGGSFLASAANAAGGGATSYAASGEPIVKAVQQAAPAVVSIDTTARVNYRVFDSPSDEFWGQGGRSVTREAPSGAGSGVLLEGGYVLTNQHVVGDAVDSGGTIKISLADGRQLTARAVGADRATDIALLRVSDSGDGKGKTGSLPVAPLGATDALLPGQTVIAIGNPVGLSASVSSGVVSALGRPLRMEDRTYENLIQTDTAINPGNSGGALIDLAGRVVGINTLVRTDAQNIGFAIPIKTALRIVDQLKKYGKVRRPTDGVIALEMTPRVARFLNLPSNTRGVAVQDLYRNSPADQAGLRQGDVIVQINDTPIGDEPTYRKTLESLKIGDEITLTLLRNGARQTARLRLAEAR